MAIYKIIFTDVGLAKLSNAQVTQDKLNITHMAIGDANGTPYTPSGQETALKNEVYRTTAIVKTSEDDANWIEVEGVIPADVGDFTIEEFGLYDTDGDLVAISNYPSTPKPILTDGSVMDLIISSVIKSSNAELIEITLDPTTITASKDYVDNNLTEVDSRLTTQLAHVAQNVNVHEYGAVGDFNEDTEVGTNNLAQLQAASIYAKDNDLDIYLPPGNYLVDGELTIWTSIVGEGVLYFDNANPNARLIISPKNEAITIDPNTVSGLTEGSTLLTGLGADYTNGTVVIESSETLIKRYLPPNNVAYTKTEVAMITDKTGRILPALDSTFDVSKIISMKIYTQEKRLNILVDIKGFGTSQKESYLIAVHRGNIYFSKNTILSTKASAIKNIISINNATLVEFNGVNISNAQHAEDGYGVALYKSAFVSFFDCHITDCRHAISGRHAKQVLIFGGTYADNIDSHWGSGYVIKDAIILRRVLFAGKDIEITNCTFYSADQSLSLRYDTPEIDGEIIFENNRIISAATGVLTLCAYVMTNYGNFDFERVLKTPSSIVIAHNTVIAESTRDIRLLNTTNSNNALHKHNNFLNVEIENNTIVNDNKTSVIMMYTPNQQENTKDSRLRIVNQKMMGGKTSDLMNLTIRGGDARTATWKYVIDIDSCDNVSVYADQNTYKRLTFNKSSINFIGRIFSDVEPNGNTYGVFFNDCILNNTTMTIDKLDWHLSNCIIDGEFVAQEPTKTKLKRSVGTYATTTASGAGIDTSVNYLSYLRQA